MIALVSFIIAAIVLYLIPTIVAVLGLKRNWFAILMLNLLLGWTFVGWVCSLVWACMAEPERQALP